MTNELRYAKPHGDNYLIAPRMGVSDVYQRDRDEWVRINCFFANEDEARDWIDGGCPELSDPVADMLRDA